MLVHEKSNTRRTWTPHRVEGWYMGPAMEHYMCYRVISSKTGRERITGTVQFFPHDVQFPGCSATYRAIEVASELTDTISNFKHTSPLKYVRDEQLTAHVTLSDMFNGAIQQNSKITGKDANIEALEQQIVPSAPVITPRSSPRVDTHRVTPLPSHTPFPRVNTSLNIPKGPHIIPYE